MTVGLANSAPEACSPPRHRQELGVGVGDPAPLSDSGTKGCVA